VVCGGEWNSDWARQKRVGRMSRYAAVKAIKNSKEEALRPVS